MNQESKKIQYANEEDTIDLRELWIRLMKRKVLVLMITAFVTIGAIAYGFTAKSVYGGSVLLEIGEVVNNINEVNEVNSLSRVKLDNVNNLHTIMSNLYGITASIPKGTDLLKLESSGYDKEVVRANLEKGINFIIKRHSENAKLYSSKEAQVKMTQIIGKVTVGDNAIMPKKIPIIIVAFMTGLILSVFLAFFLEFIQAGKKEGIEEA